MQARCGTPEGATVPGSRRGDVVLLGALFAFVFLCVFFVVESRVDTTLLYLRGPGMFVFDLAFLREYLDYPGRPARYLTLLLEESYWFPVLGALVVSGLVTLLGVASRIFFSRIVPKGAGFLRSTSGWVALLLPALLALIGYVRYAPPDMVGLNVALLLALLYTVTFPRRPLLRIPVFFLLLAGLLLFRPDMSPLFAALCALFEVAGQRRNATGIVYVIAGAAPPALVSSFCFHLPGKDILARTLPLFVPRPDLLPVVLLCLFLLLHVVVARLRRSVPLLVLGLVVFLAAIQWDFRAPLPGLLSLALILVPVGYRLLSEVPGLGEWNSGKLVTTSVLGGLSVAFVLLALLSFDREERDYLRVMRRCQARDWQGTLEIADRLPTKEYYDHPSIYGMVTRSLFHSGRLPYDLLKYPVSLVYMEPPPLPGPRKPWPEGDPCDTVEMCMDLGLLNYAELMVYDVLDYPEPPARAYELLALVYIVKGNPAAARPLLEKLKKTVPHRAWAEHYEALIDGDPGAGRDKALEESRTNMIPRDRPKDAADAIRLRQADWSWEIAYEKLLETNARNRMAFEYLMTYYLLVDRPDKVVANLPRMRQLGYGKMPTLYQEAILTNYYLTGQKPVGLEKGDIDPSLTEKYRYLGGLYLQHRGYAGATLGALAGRYRDTYFAYCMWYRCHEQTAK